MGKRRWPARCRARPSRRRSCAASTARRVTDVQGFRFDPKPWNQAQVACALPGASFTEEILSSIDGAESDIIFRF